MASSNTTTQPRPKTEEEEEEEEELSHLKLSLPQEVWLNSPLLYLYQGFWSPNIEATIALQNHFQALDTDILITSLRKAGTTWLKALLFSICNRAEHPPSDTPLLDHSSHELIHQLESNIYASSRSPDLSSYKSPRTLGTHLPYQALPDTIKYSNCKIICICRNPLDLFTSSWLFYLNFDENKTINADDDMIWQYLDKFCEGKFPFGPYEGHVLGYWKQSLQRPEKVLFVKYEEIKADPKRLLKQVVEFVGCPFSDEEEMQGVIDGIIELCSIQKMKEVEANNSRNRPYHRIHNKWLFRKGEVGDWVNNLTPAMVQKLEKFMEEKFIDSGLTFK